MRRFLALVIMAWSCDASAADWRPAKDYLFLADDCATSDDPKRCQLMKDSWERDYNGAIAGDYQGQRNVAFCLSTGCKEIYGTALRTNPVLGCAWRVVIVSSGHLDADKLDGDGMKIYCGPQYLDDVGRTMADAQARTILKMIQSGAQLQN